MKFEKYTVAGGRHVEGDAQWDDIEAARGFAQTHRLQLIALVFELADSELIEDYTDEPSDDENEDE